MLPNHNHGGAYQAHGSGFFSGAYDLGDVFVSRDVVGVCRLSRAVGSCKISRRLLQVSTAHSISTSFVNAKAKRRQYKRTASEADKVHG